MLQIVLSDSPQLYLFQHTEIIFDNYLIEFE